MARQCQRPADMVVTPASPTLAEGLDRWIVVPSSSSPVWLFPQPEPPVAEAAWAGGRANHPDPRTIATVAMTAAELRPKVRRRKVIPSTPCPRGRGARVRWLSQRAPEDRSHLDIGRRWTRLKDVGAQACYWHLTFRRLRTARGRSG